MTLEPAKPLLGGPHRLDEEERDEPEDHSENNREEDHLRPTEPRDRVQESGHRGPNAADEMGDDSRNDARKKHGVFDPPEVENLDAEERAGDRSSEDGREAGADAADHETAAVRVVQPEKVGEQARDRGSDLGAGPFLADRASERERQDRREELHGRDFPVDAPRALVHGANDGFRSVTARGRSESPHEEHAQGQRSGQKPGGREPLSEDASHGRIRRGERPEEPARAQPDAQAGAGAEKRPLQRADDERGVLGVPAGLVREAGAKVASSGGVNVPSREMWSRRFSAQADSSWPVANGRSFP